MIDFFLGITAGLVLSVLLLRAAIKRLIKRLESELDRTEGTLEILIEEVQGVFFFYDKSNNRFLAQSNSFTDAEEKLKAMMSAGQNAVITGDKDVIQKFQATKSAN